MTPLPMKLSMRTFYSAESVTEGHPDKLCDLIADNVLDACLAGDPASRVACEVMATRGHIIVAGEITTEANPDVFNIARDVLHSVGYDPKSFQIDCYLHPQSPDIAGAVEVPADSHEDDEAIGAGDQGVVIGYACNETPELMPMPVIIAHRLTSLLTLARMTDAVYGIGPDGKAMVVVEYGASSQRFTIKTGNIAFRMPLSSRLRFPTIKTSQRCVRWPGTFFRIWSRLCRKSIA